MTSSSRGPGPYSFSPSLPMTENMNRTNSPTYGTNPKKIHQPDLLMSCNLRTRSASIGINDAMKNIPIKPSPIFSEFKSIPNKIKAMHTMHSKRKNHQYSERVALPEKVAYFV